MAQQQGGRSNQQTSANKQGTSEAEKYGKNPNKPVADETMGKNTKPTRDTAK